MKRMAGRKTPKSLLTKFVVRKAQHLDLRRKKLFDTWRNCRCVEYLPEGVPYKVTSNPEVRRYSGTFVRGLNQPLILVPAGLSRAERVNVARHEFHEWQRARPLSSPGLKGNSDWAAHKAAQRGENPRLSRSVVEKTGPVIGKKGGKSKP